jgi:hypothetical protein
MEFPEIYTRSGPRRVCRKRKNWKEFQKPSKAYASQMQRVGGYEYTTLSDPKGRAAKVSEFLTSFVAFTHRLDKLDFKKI